VAKIDNQTAIQGHISLLNTCSLQLQHEVSNKQLP